MRYIGLYLRTCLWITELNSVSHYLITVIIGSYLLQSQYALKSSVNKSVTCTSIRSQSSRSTRNINLVPYSIYTEMESKLTTKCWYNICRLCMRLALLFVAFLWSLINSLPCFALVFSHFLRHGMQSGSLSSSEMRTYRKMRWLIYTSA